MSGGSVVAEVVEAVAAADHVEPTDLEPLYEYVDPATLERLGEADTGEWRFTFQYGDHQVTVTHDDRIFVDGVVAAASIP